MTDAGRSAFKRKEWDTYALARFVDTDDVEAVKVERDQDADDDSAPRFIELSIGVARQIAKTAGWL